METLLGIEHPAVRGVGTSLKRELLAQDGPVGGELGQLTAEKGLNLGIDRSLLSISSGSVGEIELCPYHGPGLLSQFHDKGKKFS